MSRALKTVAAAASLLLLWACSTGPNPPEERQPAPELLEYKQLQHWLSLQRQVDSMSNKEVYSELKRISSPEDPDEVFYYALLHQHLDAYGSWTVARDRFRELRLAPGLTDAQRQLTAIFEDYSQSRINSYHKHELLPDEKNLLESEKQVLREKLDAAEAERLLLGERIQAITELETKISTREEE